MIIKIEFKKSQIKLLQTVLEVYGDDILSQQDETWTTREKNKFKSLLSKFTNIEAHIKYENTIMRKIESEKKARLSMTSSITQVRNDMRHEVKKQNKEIEKICDAVLEMRKIYKELTIANR